MARSNGPTVEHNGRRRFGQLEQEVLAAMWSSTVPMTPADVIAALPSDLAYTTVTTILTRLHAKGVLDRSKVGRAYAYRPVVQESAAVAQQVRRILDLGQDRTAVLQGFIDGLSDEEEDTLRELLASIDGDK